MKNIIIRPYKKEDRQSLRDLCCDVANRGQPIEDLLPDREVAADLLSKYYTDYEPESSFIALSDGKLVGYINGGLDNRRYGLVMFWLLMPPLLIKAFKRGFFFKPQIRQLFKGMIKNWRRIFVWRKKSFHSHQGHLHIGVADDCRGQKVGQRLVETLIDYARTTGIGELAASVHDQNKNACHFFESQGFKVRENHPMVTINHGKEENYHSLLYVKTITAH